MPLRASLAEVCHNLRHQNSDGFMYTQVQYFSLIDNLLTRLSVEFDIEMNRHVVSMLVTYRTGDWLYGDVGSTLDTKIWRCNTNQNPVIVYGPKWDDEQTAFERKLENELRSAISRLLDS